MGYTCLVLVGILVCLLCANVPSVVCALIYWYKFKTPKAILKGILMPYLFASALLLLLTIGSMIVYNAKGLDFFGGDVRRMPLENGVLLSTMDYDPYNATLNYNNRYSDFMVDELAFASDTLFFHKSINEILFDEDGNEIPSDTSLYGYLLLATSEIIEISATDSVIEELDWYDIKTVYQQRESELTNTGLWIVFLLSLLLSTLLSYLVHRYLLN